MTTKANWANCPKYLTVILTKIAYLVEIIYQTNPDILHLNFICLMFKQGNKRTKQA